MHWPLFLALKYLFPSGKGLTFFTFISILGVALGVMVLVVVQSVMNGFHHLIEEKIVQLNGDIKILSPAIIEDAESLQKELQAIQGVKGLTPFVHGIALVQHNEYVQFPKILGVDLSSVEKVLPLSKFIKMGSLTALSKGFFFSRPLAQSLDVALEEKVDVYSPLMLEALKKDEILLPIEIPIVGIFETGWADADRDTAICSLETLQHLYGLGKGIHGFSIKLEPGLDPHQFAQMLKQRLPDPLRAYSWLELNEDLFYVLRLEKTMMFFVVFFVILVAAFSISSGLMTFVVRKKREIGLLAVFGATRKEIVQIFCFQSLIIGVSGVILGIMGGLSALCFRNQVMALLSKWFLPKDLLWKFYSFAHLPVYYKIADFMIIAIATLLIAFCASLLPAWRASRLTLASNLRGE